MERDQCAISALLPATLATATKYLTKQHEEHVPTLYLARSHEEHGPLRGKELSDETGYAMNDNTH